MILLNIKNGTQFTLRAKYNYAFENFYSQDINRVPTAVMPNSIFCLIANDAGEARVDWGDGIIEEYPFVATDKGTYVCAFRSLLSDSFKGNGNDWSVGNDASGTPIVPYANHHYADDDINLDRKITISCTNSQLTTLSSNLTCFTGFPVIESDSLELLSLVYTKYINEIPFDRIVNMKKLVRLTLSYLGSEKMQIIPTGVFDLPNLQILNLSGVFDLGNPDSSNLRLIGKLKNLQELNLWNCGITTYIKEFNDIPNLKKLWVSTNIDGAPSYNEVSQINQSLNYYNNLYATGARTEWDNLSGKGVEKVWGLDCWDSRGLRVDILPEYIKEMRSISSFNMGQTLLTQERADTFVNTLYDYIMSWDKLTMAQQATDGIKNQFYNLYVTAYSAIYQSDKRPNGTYQAPSGFVLGSANGTPSSPMEKIYVLTNNYSQTWVVRPETARNTRNAIPEGYYLDDSVIYSDNEPIYNNEIKPIEDENNNY